MARVKVDSKSLNRCIKEINDREREEFAREMERKKIIPSLPSDMWELSDEVFAEYDKEITKIIKEEISKIKYRSGRRVINNNDIHRRISNEKIPYYGYGVMHNENGADGGTYDIINDSHGYRLYKIKNIVARRRSISYWFGKVPGWDADDRIKSKQFGYAFPLYTNSGNFPMYQPSKYPSKYKKYVYMPYIIDVQPSAKNFVYWTDKETGERRRSTGTMSGGRVDRTWHNKNDKEFIQRIVNRINSELTAKKNINGKMYVIEDYNPELNMGTRSRKKVDVGYWVKLTAKVGKKFK